MMKEEFEALALRGNQEIGQVMYESIERYYTSDNDYHARFGGRNETKQDFVKRIFGGKVNTPRSIARKIADEANRENRWGRENGTPDWKAHLDEQETRIREHYDAILQYGM